MTLTEALERSMIETAITLFLSIFINGMEGINNPITVVAMILFVVSLCKFTTLFIVSIYEQYKKEQSKRKRA
jgi:hypothetical protein